jgi:membrane-bound serine protease (ClpP class)
MPSSAAERTGGPRRASTRRVFARYLAFEAPSWALLLVVLVVLVRVWDLSTPLAMLVLALWVVKDLALFPVLRIAYEPVGGSGGAESLIGAIGTVSADLDPEGWVRIGAERWRARVARDHAPVPAGAAVRVMKVDGLLLGVEPAAVGFRAGEGPGPSRADA